MKNYKKHIIKYLDHDYAETYCGIRSDKCTSDFVENAQFIREWENIDKEDKSICKTCLKNKSKQNA